MEARILKRIFIYVWSVFPIGLICMMLLVSGTVSIEYHGFAVDSQNVLYIGKSGVIEKYDDGELIGTINPKTSRGYYFTIHSGDKIVLTTGTNVYIMDLEENILSQREEPTSSTYVDLQFTRKFIAEDGEVYVLRNPFGRMVICTEDGGVIYKMPVLDWVVRICLALCAISMVICIPIIIYKSRKEYFLYKNNSGLQ